MVHGWFMTNPTLRSLSTDWLLPARGWCWAVLPPLFVFNELYDLILDFVRELLVQRIDVLFAAGSCLELNWTEHGSATMYVF